jgi:ABC-type multidrug transport system permease subunit
LLLTLQAFDELLLLVAGGRTAYFGPLGDGAERLVDHLQSIPKVIPIRPRANPATWMLEVTASAAEEAMHVDFAEAYASSDLAREMDRVIAQHEQPAPGSQPLQLAHLGVAPWNVQFKANFRRFWLQYWRAPEYNLTRLIVTIGVALVFGSLFWDQGNDVSDAAGVLNVAGVIFSSVLFIGITDCLTVQHLAASQRAVMYRERAAGYYSEASFAIAQIAVEWPYLFFQTLLYSSNAYFMIGFAAEAGKFFSFVLFFFLTLCYFTCFGQAAVALTPSVALSNVLCSFFFGFWNLFCGFLKPEPALPPYWQWFYYLNPVSWSLSSLSISQLGDLDDTQLTDFEGKTVTVPQFLEERFNWQEALLWPTVAILLAFFVVFAFVNVFALRNINYQRR